MNELPRGWVEARLDELAEVRLGRQRSPKNHFGSRMRPYLRAANVTWSGFDLRDVKEMNFTKEESAVYELHPGDVLVGEASGSADEVGKPAVWRGEIEDCCFQNTLIRVRTLGPVPEYLRYFLLAEAQSGRIGRSSPGVGIHHIGAARLAAWRVPVPPLAEQRRIVAAIEEHLSRLDAAGASLSSASAKARGLRERLLDRLLDSPARLTRVGEVVASGRRIAYGVLQPGTHHESGVPLVRVGDIARGGVAAELKRIDPAIAARYPRTQLKGGEVLLTIVGTIGRSAVAPASLAGANVARAVAVIPVAAHVDPSYMALVLSAPRAAARLTALAHEVARKTLNLEDVRRFEIPLPSLDEQRKLVAEVTAALTPLNQLERALSGAGEKGQALRRSILARAFRGDLVPQDPDDEPASVLLERIAAERTDAPRATRRRATMAS